MEQKVFKLPKHPTRGEQKIVVEKPKGSVYAYVGPYLRGYTCRCGKYHKYPAYHYAHYTILMIHTCDCGRKYELVEGEATYLGRDRG